MRLLASILSCFFITSLITSCVPLPQEKVDLSTPEALAEALIVSLSSEDESMFMDQLILTEDRHKALAEYYKKKLPPETFQKHQEIIETINTSWLEVLKEGNKAGVLWKSAQFESCTYKAIHTKDNPTSTKNFTIYFTSGGHRYSLSLKSIEFLDNFYVYGSILWNGEVEVTK